MNENAVVVCVPVAEGRQVDHSWGKATVVATAHVVDGVLTGWTEDTVGWDVLHDEGHHGSHHARVARFLLERSAHAVTAAHMGQPMMTMLTKMGLVVELGAAGDAEAAVLAAAARVGEPARPRTEPEADQHRH